MRIIGWAAVISTIHDFWTMAAFLALLAVELLLKWPKRQTRHKRMR
jgi:preprotein translocase subunit SecF